MLNKRFGAVFPEEAFIAFTNSLLANSISTAFIDTTEHFAGGACKASFTVTYPINAFSIQITIIFANFRVTVFACVARITFNNSIFNNSVNHIALCAIKAFPAFFAFAFSAYAFSVLGAIVFAAC